MSALSLCNQPTSVMYPLLFGRSPASYPNLKTHPPEDAWDFRERLKTSVKLTFSDFDFSTMGLYGGVFPFTDISYKTVNLCDLQLMVTFYMEFKEHKEKIFSMELNESNDIDKLRQKLEVLYNFWDILRYLTIRKRQGLKGKQMSDKQRKERGPGYDTKVTHFEFPFMFPVEFRPKMKKLGTFTVPLW